jgi:hypothetical protein
MSDPQSLSYVAFEWVTSLLIDASYLRDGGDPNGTADRVLTDGTSNSVVVGGVCGSV